MRLKLLPLALAMATCPMLAHGENLLDAYRQARANDPVLAQAEAQRLSTGEAVPIARSQLLPQVDASLSLNQTTGGRTGTFVDSNNQIQQLPDTGHIRQRQLSANLSQTVLDFSKFANLKAAHSQVDSQEAQYQAELQNLIVRVSQAYFDVLTAEDELDFAKSNEQALARELDQAQERFNVGLSAITDVQDAKARHDSATAQVITAQNALDDFREALTQITGHPVGELDKLRDTLPMDPPQPNDQATWVKTALQTNPTILAQQYNVDAAEHNISSARAGHLPTISAGVSYGKGATWAQVGHYNNRSPASTTIGLTLSVPIFSGGYTHALVKQSIYDRDSASDALEIQRRQVIRDTRGAFRSVIAGISEVEATKAAVTSSQSAVDANQAGFEVGTRTIVDVLNAQQALTQARSQYSQARHQFILNKLLLEQAAGSIDIKDLEAVNALLQPPASLPASAQPSP
jgi:outer membrane protein